MRARLFFPALWLLSLWLPVLHLWAQGRPLGPWQILSKRVRTTKDDDGWGVAKADTTTYVANKTWLLPVCWDVVPDSIRLFLNCENPLIAPDNPSKSEASIRFSAIGATIRLDAQSQQLLIAPFDSVVKLRAYQGGVLLFQHEFKAIPPPHPTILYYCSLDPMFTLGGRQVYQCSLKAMPTAYFATIMSMDARFRITKASITLLRNGIPIQPSMPYDGHQLNVAELRKIAVSGDQLRIDVETVERMNFRGEVEKVPLAQKRLIPVN